VKRKEKEPRGKEGEHTIYEEEVRAQKRKGRKKEDYS
jgi:hypothetical protein